jgi:FtsP/CotA-like multicopper oxidase with cupredoxin domain
LGYSDCDPRYIKEGNLTGPFAKNLNVLQLPEKDAVSNAVEIFSLLNANYLQWSYWIIQTGGNHPIHLHGHDFYILGTGIGTFTNDTVKTLNFVNPTRRDVAMASGWLALAFRTDNPGSWLMHCHIVSTTLDTPRLI